LGADIVNAKYIQRSECEATQLEDEWVILDTHLYTITKINEVGGFCWSLLTQPRTLHMLVQAVTDEYNAVISTETVQQDIERFLSDLMSYGLVEHAS
jgi:Coenzyme PQQ synthesis protein D (PqqD)